MANLQPSVILWTEPGQVNEFGQPIGRAMDDWKPAKTLSHDDGAMHGQYCRLEPISAKAHASQLFQAYAQAPDASLFTYLPWGPFDSEIDVAALIASRFIKHSYLGYAIVVDDRAVGLLCYITQDEGKGVVEIGALTYSPQLQRTRASTEALYLMAQRAFAQGFRRVMWKCDSLNQASCSAAQRFGFRFEGIWRNALVYRNRSRDHAWFAMTDDDWGLVEPRMKRWLAPSNFDDAGVQKASLRDV